MHELDDLSKNNDIIGHIKHISLPSVKDNLDFFTLHRQNQRQKLSLAGVGL